MLTQCFIVVIIILLLLVDRWKPNKFVKLHQQIGNDLTYFPIARNAFNFLGNNVDVMTKTIQITKESLKKTHNAATFWIGHIFFVLSSDVDQAMAVLKSTHHKHLLHKFSEHLNGNGIIFAPVDIWHERRKILAPTFAPRHVDKFIVVFEAQSKILVEILKSKVGKGNVACWDYVFRNTMDSLCGTVFGVKIEMQRQEDHPFFNAYVKYFENAVDRLFRPWLHLDALYKLLPVYTRQKEMKKIILEFIDNLIFKNKDLIREGHGNGTYAVNLHNNETHFKTIMELITDNSEYTHEELREESLVLLIAGSETTAIGISTAMLLLSQHTDVQEKVYEEIRENVGNPEKPLQLKDLLKLKYTKAVINEILRLYPPIPFILRYCNEDVQVSPGATLPKGINAIINVLGLHRNPQYWGEDVDDFNPDRFMSGPIPKAFMPFSHGPRNCVGGQYAMLSITTTLVTLLRQYRFTPALNFTYDKNNPLRLSYSVSMKHVDKYPIQIENREKM